MRRWVAIVGAVFVAVVSAACINLPGDTSQIVLLSSGTVEWGTPSNPDTWTYQFYENKAYTCAKSGYQTFTVLTPPEDLSDPNAVRPLWVWMPGGGAGYWQNGKFEPYDDLGQIYAGNQEGVSTDKKGGLFDDVVSARFRQVRVSYCDRDAYAGDGGADPGNPNPQITTNGLMATKAAIQFTEEHEPTSKFFLHGGSAGSDGVYNLALGLQEQGLAPAGVVGDSGVENSAFWQAVHDQQVPCNWAAKLNPTTIPLITARFAPELQGASNEPAALVSSGRLTVPVAEVWDHGDPVGCGAFEQVNGTWTTKPMSCPASTQPPANLGMPPSPSDCKFWPLAQAIGNQGSSSKSISLEVCVDSSNLMQSPPTPPVIDGGTNGCDHHIVTTQDARSWTPSGPEDFDATIWTWVQSRLADPPPGPAPTGGTTLGNAVTWTGWNGLTAQQQDYEEAYMGRLGGPTYLTVSWCQVEPHQPAPGQPPVYQWTYPDGVLSASQGRPLYLKIDTGDCWGTKHGEKDAKSMMVLPQFQSDYTGFVTAFVQRYSAKGVHEYAIQNEPADNILWGGTLSDLETLTGWAVPAIRSADPSAAIADWGIASPDYGAGIVQRLLEANQDSAAVDAYNTYYAWDHENFGASFVYPIPNDQTGVNDLNAFLAGQGAEWIQYLHADEQLLQSAAPGQPPTFDVREVHYYEPPQGAPALIDYLQATTPASTPIDVFEVGERWPIAYPPQPPPTAQQQIDNMVESVTQLATGGMRTEMWLPLVNADQRDQHHLGLISPDGTAPPPGQPWPDPEGRTYLELAPIVHGPARSVGTAHLTGGAFTTSSGGSSLVLWSTTGADQPVTLPGISAATTDTGAPVPVDNDTFTVGATPVFVTTSVPPWTAAGLLP